MTTQLLAAALTPHAVLDFWFNDNGQPAPSSVLGKRWFAGGTVVDAAIAERFGWAVDQAVANGLKDWESAPRERLALIVLLDQFTRNLYRGTVKAFMGDHRARRLATTGWVHGEFDDFSWIERVATLMPFEHSENLDDQRFCVAQMERISATVTESERAFADGFVNAARQHHDIVAEFGRFPHRNPVMGRANTAAEDAFMHDGPRFGQ
ncbi:DUF924 family protein [Litorivicinus lipolyticus]|uniref:DUF924 family protein n=1 Tax=Litorivicinus lipolyticus TaxID=418701 RepID=A0A5Q2QCW5_9GAMM|nr:DUF924 family protein [Litorivicinus lipolyticus]QGG79866.1 DUF924 family protein [Litorivicinus lipolyticus]